MKSANAKNLLLASILATFVVGCGGGSSDSGSTTPEIPVAPTTPAKIFGSVEAVSTTNQTITVNGYTLQTAGTPINYEDNILELADLTPGVQVEVETLKGKAIDIELNPAIAGVVSEVQGNKLVVNGTTFTFSALNSDIQVGSWVMISALQQNDGTWSVSSVNQAPVLTHAEIEGRISLLDTTASKFNIGSMQVEYSNATIEYGDILKNGQWVEVDGNFENSHFVAAKIDVENDTDYDGVEIEGTITWVNSELSYFEIDNRTKIQVTANTKFEDGVKTDLKSGNQVDVDMANSSSGLVATNIDFENQQPEIPVTQAREFSNQGFATLNSGIVTINGTEFVIDAATHFDDGLTEAMLNNIWIEVEGIEVKATALTPAHWLIKEIERETKETEISLEGPVSNNSLWNYTSSDNSLAQFDGKWVEVECMLNGDDLLNCRLD
ncbi:DUF5666 domain-containing protein [Shewanella woodyi]|uniref:Conserved hypothetical lipoprotein n=1 Tax=Shewanella woodyi (strain ATCC 51908 / MS32) TaxID=392500 RepID=B1KKR6_SHEWM|nr:DUF5666 domain-containing protein [Shewanella woodyi]ACA87283.1 conserved hypothetical lipoprotein [Shewanella woodyi ATCC 51908]